MSKMSTAQHTLLCMKNFEQESRSTYYSLCCEQRELAGLPNISRNVSYADEA